MKPMSRSITMIRIAYITLGSFVFIKLSIEIELPSLDLVVSSIGRS